MSERHDYALTDFTTTAASRSISSRSRRGTAAEPICRPDRAPGEQSTLTALRCRFGELIVWRERAAPPPRSSLLHEWTWELAAWLVAAISLVCLIIIFAVYSDKPLRQWRADITPATTVAILSQVGQTAILAPVTACICQSMWLWLDKESRVAHQANSNGHQPRLITMQTYDDGSRGPISSLLLLWKRPDA